MKQKYSIVVTLLIVSLSLLSPATYVLSDAGGEKYGGTLRVALPAEPGTLFPTITTSYTTHAIVDPIFETLVHMDLEWNFIPRLAESWTVSADSLKYTFNLVKNAKWHDGFAFTSADVKFTFEEAIYPYAPTGHVFEESIDSIETPDEYTVIFNMKQIFSQFLIHLSYPLWSSIIPKHLYENTDILNNPANWDPIGTGPFMFQEYVKGSHVGLVRNPSYYVEGLPYLDEVVITIIKDPAARVMAFEAGEVDILGMGTPLSEVSRLSKLPGVKYTSDCARGWGPVVSHNINLGPLGHEAIKDRRVRQALAHTLDKEAIKSDCYFGFPNVADSEIHPGSPFYNASAITVYDYDLTKADALLSEAGYPKDADGKRFPLRVVLTTGYSDRLKAMEIWRESLLQIGIDLEILPLDSPALLERVCVKGDFDILLSVSWTGPDPITALGRFVVSWNIKPGTIWANYAFINYTEIDEIFTQLPTESDPAEIKSLWSRYQEIGSTECYSITSVADPYMQIWRDFENVQDLFFMSTEYRDTYWIEGEASTGEVLPMWVVAAVGIVAVGVIIAAVIFWRRRK